MSTTFTFRDAPGFWRETLAVTGGSVAAGVAVGVLGPAVLGLPVMQSLQQLIRGCPPPMELPQAGHFVQEHGESIAQAAVAHFRPA